MTSPAPAETPLRQAWMRPVGIQAGRPAARSLDRLVQVCLGLARLRMPVSPGVSAVSSRILVNNAGERGRLTATFTWSTSPREPFNAGGRGEESRRAPLLAAGACENLEGIIRRGTGWAKGARPGRERGRHEQRACPFFWQHGGDQPSAEECAHSTVFVPPDGRKVFFLILTTSQQSSKASGLLGTVKVLGECESRDASE